MAKPLTVVARGLLRGYVVVVPIGVLRTCCTNVVQAKDCCSRHAFSTCLMVEGVSAEPLASTRRSPDTSICNEYWNNDKAAKAHAA